MFLIDFIGCCATKMSCHFILLIQVVLFQANVQSGFRFRSLIYCLFWMQKVSRVVTRLVGQYGRAGLVTQAPYAVGKNSKPLNIAHRGLAGLFPENTIPAFEAALYSGADLVELDVVFTKDDHLLVMHDPYLARITNADSVKLDQPKETRYYATEQRNVTDWWTDRLKLEDLLQLKVKQKQAKNRITCLDFQFGFATLGKVIEKVKAFNKLHNGARNPDGNIGGILIEAKDGDMYREIYQNRKSIGKEILKVLKEHQIDTWQKSIDNKCPIYLHSFDAYTVKEWNDQGSDLPRNLLIEETTRPQNMSVYDYIREASTYSHGIGIEDVLLWDSKNKRPNYELIQKIKDLKMLTHVWTFKDDSLIFDAKTNIEAYRIGQNQIGLDGIITEFSDTFSGISHFLAEQKQRETRK